MPDNADVNANGDGEGNTDLRTFLRNKFDNETTQRQLASAIGYAESQLSRYMNGDLKEPSVRFFIGIAWFFNLPLYTVLRMAGYDVPKEATEHSPAEHELIRTYRVMDEQDRDFLLRIARGFAEDAEEKEEA